MLPNLAALSLVATGAKDDVNAKRQKTLEEAWEEAEEEQEMEEALAPALAELRAKAEALRENYRAEKRAAPVRKEVFDKEDLVREILSALRNDTIDGWEICQMVGRWCSLDKARRAACDNAFWDEMSQRIWGEAPKQLFGAAFITPRNRFIWTCDLERDIRRGARKLTEDNRYANVKRFVLAAIAGSGHSAYKVLSHASEALRDDEDVVRAAVRKNALALQYASPRLQALGKQFLEVDPREMSWVDWSNQGHGLDPTEFQLKWATAVLLLLLTDDWDKLSVKKIARRLMEDAEFYAHRPELKRLVDAVLKYTLRLRAEGAVYYQNNAY